MKKIVLLSSMSSTPHLFITAGSDRLPALGVKVPLLISIHPSMKLLDRVRDLRRAMKSQSKINHTSPLVQLLHHFWYRRINVTESDASLNSGQVGSGQAGSGRVNRAEFKQIVNVFSANDDLVIQRIRELDCDMGIVLGSDVISRRTLDAIGIPLFNVHFSDPAFVRGRPPVFWEILDQRDTISLTLHRVTPELDAGDVLLQRKVPIHWQPDLKETILQTRRATTSPLLELLFEGLGQLIDGSAQFQTSPAGPLRTTPTFRQMIRAQRICAQRYKNSQE